MTRERPDGLTLREKLSQADLLGRELLELLEHGLIPQNQVLLKTAQQGLDSLEEGEVTDLTIRSTIENVLHSGSFVRHNADHLLLFLNSIESDLQQIFRVG